MERKALQRALRIIWCCYVKNDHPHGKRKLQNVWSYLYVNGVGRESL